MLEGKIFRRERCFACRLGRAHSCSTAMQGHAPSSIAAYDNVSCNCSRGHPISIFGIACSFTRTLRVACRSRRHTAFQFLCYPYYSVRACVVVCGARGDS